MNARNFDTINVIIRCLSLVQSLLKGRNAPIWRIGKRGVNIYLAQESSAPLGSGLSEFDSSHGSGALGGFPSTPKNPFSEFAYPIQSASFTW